MFLNLSVFARRNPLSCSQPVFAFCSVAVACAMTVAQPTFGALKQHKTLHPIAAAKARPLSAVTLPSWTGDVQPSLVYRAAAHPIGAHNAVSFWLQGDSLPGGVSIYLFASGGSAANPLPVPGSGTDSEPLWPAWISQPISTNYTGWRKILLKDTDFTYRAPMAPDNSTQSAPFSSADTFAVASSKTSGTIYLDAVNWISVDAQGEPVGEPSAVDNFSDGDVASWRVRGTPEAVANLTLGISSNQSDVKEDSISLKLGYSNASLQRAFLARSVARSLSTSGSDYLVSVPTSPFERVLPSSLPVTSEISSRVVIVECPEQTSCGSFVLYSLHGLNNVSVQLPNDLYAIGKSIPKSNVDISVVKVWNRKGSGVLIDPDSAGPTPELLVKDDREQLASVSGTPPDVRLTGDVSTDIPANTEKQFWIDVTVPRNTPPGQYTGQIVVASAQQPPFKLSLETDVLPLRLLSPAKQYVINYRGKLGAGDTADVLPGDHVTQTELSSELADVSTHGLRYISLSDAPDTLPADLTAEQQFNFQTPVVYPVNSGSAGLATARAVSKLSLDQSQYYFLVPNGPTMAVDLFRLSHAGFQTAAVIRSQDDYNSSVNNLDVAIYPVENPYVQALLSSNGRRQSSTRDWLTWPAAQANPQVDRLYSGYLLWKTNLYGGYISDYQTCYGPNPYDDSTPTSDTVHGALRPAMLTYPAQQGVIDTIQWESIREGINDARYLTTFYAALRECKDAKVDLVQVAKAEADVSAFLAKDFWLMSDSDYENGRLMIANYALQLRRAVDGYNSTQNGDSPHISTEPKEKRNSG